MDPIINQIKKAHHILLASHREPDGDAISSLLALGLAIGKLNKKTTIYIDNQEFSESTAYCIEGYELVVCKKPFDSYSIDPDNAIVEHY